MTWLLWSIAFLFTPPGLLVCYIGYIQYERGPKWVAFKLFGILGYLPDVFYNFVLCLLMGRLPTKPTITVELPTLAQLPGLRGEVAIALANFLNWIAPSGQHVQLNPR